MDNRTPDTTAPSIEGIEISSDPGTDETYAVDDMISVTVRYDEPVTVDTVRGTPTLDLLVGTRRKRASASVGPDRPAVVFVYTVEKGDEDEDGVSVPRGASRSMEERSWIWRTTRRHGATRRWRRRRATRWMRACRNWRA